MLLAAGASARLGTPKQLLRYNGQTLLQHLVQTAASSKASPLITVLGANANIILPELHENKHPVIVNTEWRSGMASAIVCGIEELLKLSPAADGVILMVCDQPYVTASLLDELIAAQHSTGKPIITSHYENIPGPPALFHKSIFPELLELKGDTGARKIVQQHGDEIATIPFPKGNIDIDTQADYELFLKTLQRT